MNQPLLKELRPKHWVKNLLLLALPLSNGFESSEGNFPTIFLRFIVEFIALSLISSANYLINDLVDVHSDRVHPIKHKRPYAAGLISQEIMLVLTVCLFLLSNLLVYSFFGSQVLIVNLIFGLLQLLYSLKIKKYPVLDVVFLASLFVFRTAIPYMYENIVFSFWFTYLILATALYLAFAKRFIEKRISVSGDSRKVLAYYDSEQLRSWMTICVTVFLVVFLMWTKEQFSLTSESRGVFLLFSGLPILIFWIRFTYYLNSLDDDDVTLALVKNPTNIVLLLIFGVLYFVGKGYL